MKTTCLSTSRPRVLCAFILFFSMGPSGFVLGGNIPTVYTDVFKTIHDGRAPKWQGMKDVDAWFDDERDLIENVALDWLRADHDTLNWRRGLLLGRRIASAPICKAVFNSVENELTRTVVNEQPIGEDDHMKLAGPIVLLAACKDGRALPVLHRLLADT